MSALKKEELRRLYATMLRIRLVEERIAAVYSEQEMRCPVHLCIGQEAVAAGVCHNLSRQDMAFSSHRSHGHYLAKRGDLKRMIAELYGKATGCSQGKGGSMHLVDIPAGFMGSAPIVGSTLPIAVGSAFGNQLQGKNYVTAVFFGDGAVEEGVFHESVNFAVLKKLPVLFICENNLYSVYSPLEVRQPKGREIFSVAQGHGIPCEQGDGNDALEVLRLSAKAIQRARKGEGPGFLEFKTYRWREHCGPEYDNDLGYRSAKEFEKWKKQCPVNAFEKKLLKNGVLSLDGIKTLRRSVNEEIEEAFLYAKRSPFPQPSALEQNIYAN